MTTASNVVADGNYTPNWENSQKELAATGTSVSIGNSDHTKLPDSDGTASEVEGKADRVVVGNGDFEEVGRVDFEVGVEGKIDSGQQGIHNHMGVVVDYNYSYYPFEFKKIKNTSFLQQIILQSTHTYNDINRWGYIKRYTNTN